MRKLTVAVLFGGTSSEHDISLKSAHFILKNIPKDKYEIVCIGITKKGRWLFYPGDYDLIPTGEWERHSDCSGAVLSPDATHKGILKILPDNQTSLKKIDVIFPVLHGKFGEDGTVQGLCQLANIPCVGPNLTSSAVCMDKTITHVLLDSAGIKTAKYRWLSRKHLSELDEWCQQISQEIPFPVFVKPSNSGSSIGVGRAKNLEELKSAIKIAFSHDTKVLVEEEIIGKEVECGVLGNNSPLASIIGEITPSNEFYDYEAKYISGDSVLKIPAEITKEQSDKVRAIALKAYDVLGCSGMARVDFFVNDKEIILNEVNTIPGFTSISMYPVLIEKSGIKADKLVDELIQLAIRQPYEI